MQYEFGSYRFDTDSRVLSGAAGEIVLRPKVFALLSLLIAERDSAISDAVQPRAGARDHGRFTRYGIPTYRQVPKLICATGREASRHIMLTLGQNRQTKPLGFSKCGIATR